MATTTTAARRSPRRESPRHRRTGRRAAQIGFGLRVEAGVTRLDSRPAQLGVGSGLAIPVTGTPPVSAPTRRHPGISEGLLEHALQVLPRRRRPLTNYGPARTVDVSEVGGDGDVEVIPCGARHDDGNV